MPLLLAIAAGSTALAGVGWWAFGPTESEASPSVEATAVEPSAPTAEPIVEAAPAPGLDPAAPTNTDPARPEDVTAPAEAEKPAEPSQEAQAPAPEAASDPEEAEPETPAKGKKKKSASSKRAASSKPAAPTSAKAPFDTGAARAALNTAASRAAGCKGTSGTGKIQVTFATSGRVSSAQIVSGPFGGTASGNCALRHFKAAKVPAFTGNPTTVAKSFKIP
jgi:outer membrane biosynthesis protein TonB